MCPHTEHPEERSRRDSALGKEVPFLHAAYRTQDQLSFEKIAVAVCNGFHAPLAHAEPGDIWSLWGLPGLSAHLRELPPGGECAVLVSFAVRHADKAVPPAVDFFLLQGDPDGADIAALRRVKAHCLVNSGDGSTTGLLRFERPASPESLFLGVSMKKTVGRLLFRAPDLVWPDATHPQPASCVIHISSCTIDDFTLTARGWARDVARPGLPVRLALLIDGVERKQFLARTPGDAADRCIPDGAYQFAVSCLVSESERRPRVEIAGLDDQGAYVYAAEALCPTQGPPPGQRISRAMPPDADIVGAVDTVTREGIGGWALSPSYPEAAGELLLVIDGRPFSYTQCTKFMRAVQETHGGSGYAGFHFELPPSLALGAAVAYRVEACGGGKASITGGKGKIKPLSSSFVPSALAVDRTCTVPPISRERKKISLIIVNRNGAEILDEMLRSAEAVGDYQDLEWIVVDHQSSDDSAQVCRDARLRGFDLHFYRRNGNFSFSDSNNYGVERSSGEIVIFANNDLLFTTPFSDAVCRYLSDPAIGALGVTLLDHVPGVSDVTKLPVQHLGVFFNPCQVQDCLRPYEARLVKEIEDTEHQPVCAPCVTAAFMAMRREDFVALQGFDTGYMYGLEDVDLCLKVRQRLAKSVARAHDIVLIHRRGFSRKHSYHKDVSRSNNIVLNTTWANYLRRNIRRDVFRSPGFWTGIRPTVAFIVSDVGDATAAGEYYTALEFGRALQKVLPVHLRFIAKKYWYDLQGVDVLVVMVKPFAIDKVKNVSPFLLTINWMRQWFDAWADDPALYAYDYLFASSQKAAAYITEKTGRHVEVLRIASNVETFSSGKFTPNLACDYCFTGSFFSLAREIQFQLDPEAIAGKGAVYGYNWAGTPFASISRGAVPYSRLPDVYASTKIVIDDANIATKSWGSCNSRVFDALAAGSLLVTNGAEGAREIFGDLAPTFHDKDSLRETLNYWLAHDEERRERVRTLRDIVVAEHTYDNRARQFVEVLEKQPPPVRLAIKCPAVHRERAHWGDYHFAEALAGELRKKGYVVRVDCREAWDSGLANTDDVVIVLRGRLAYKPKMHQKNILWLISHPNDASTSELLAYDQVYCASAYHADLLSVSLNAPVAYLPQCVDPDRFQCIPERIHTRADRVLFVGNSRGVFRNTVRWAVENKLDIDVYGDGWEPFLKDNRLKGKLMPNEILADAYASSKYVLCDHWEDMRRLGYVSNRVLDVLAVGGRLLVDDVKGLDALVPSGYEIVTDAKELKRLVSSPLEVDIDERRNLAEWVVREHSFAVRADFIDNKICALLCGENGQV